MDVIILTEKEINPPKLHEELEAVLGADLLGVSTAEDPDRVTVHVNVTAPFELRDQIPALVEAHDASKLTSEQQAEADRRAALDALRKPWAEWTTADREDFVRVLAEEMGIISGGMD